MTNCNYSEHAKIQREEIQKQIEELQTALKLLEIEENRRTPCEKAYRDAYGEFPITDSMSGGDKDYIAWDAFQKGYNAAYKEPEDIVWKSVALRFGEKLSDIGPCGYYEFSPDEWFEWVVNTYEKLSDDVVNLLKKEKQAKKLQEKEGDLKPHWESKKQEPKTLWRRFYDEKWSDSACDEFCKIVEKWLYDNTTTVEEDYHTVTIKLKKGMLKSEK